MQREQEGIKLAIHETVIGRIAIAEVGGYITNLFFAGEPLPVAAAYLETPLILEAFSQLESYLSGERRAFSLQLAPTGTLFMQRVWHHVTLIPYGRTASYQEIATLAGNPQAVRAVGMANHRNPLPIFIPCHRVLGKDGSLSGYRGGVALKQALLLLEGGRAL